ncbi:glutathione S-transferase, partial [Acinetobacter baumannii]
DAALADASRVMAIWSDCRGRHGAGGEFLFGNFCIADAFYAPVVLRFRTYGVAQTDIARRYSDAILALQPLQDWLAAAAGETEVVAASEP